MYAGTREDAEVNTANLLIFEFRISVADSDATDLGRELEFGWNQVEFGSSLGLRVQGLGCRSGHDTNPLP
jgi:hypothetical protein